VKVEGDPSKLAAKHALAVLPAVFLAWTIFVSVRIHSLAVDFSSAYLPAARALLHGNDPYLLAPVTSTHAFVYPPIAAYIWIPVAVLPVGVAEALATAIVVAAIPLTLMLVGVRDWRCYAAALLWLSALWGIQTANVTTLLVLGTATVWRYRDQPTVAGSATGLVVALKLYTWPLLLFLLFTRRTRGAASPA
jgi:uncharacterized membrane protein